MQSAPLMRLWRFVRTTSLRYAVVLAALLARPVAAQVISGVVVLPDNATPAARVIVVATDEQGREASRALSSARGEYLLRLPTGGRYALKVLRIGYQPTPGPTIAVSGAGKETARIVLANQAVSLAAINVRDRETCRVNADTGLAVARVWEEARKAMLSSQLSSDEAAPLFAEWIEYDQTLDSTARLVRSQRVRTSRNPTTHAFRSRPAAFLDTAGYVVAESGGAMYFAPDAEVLLSELFARAHCFRLVAPPKESPNLLGVNFQPARDRRDKREIQGTLWVDRATAELRWLEFTFTNLNDAAMTAKPGGRVEFQRLQEGSWLVSRWNLRMAHVEMRRPDNAQFQRAMQMARPVLRAVQISGGEVTRVLRGDSLVFKTIGPSVVVQVEGTDSLVRAAGATLTLQGTDYQGIANAAGRVELSPVLAGRYRAFVKTALMDSLGMPPISEEVEASIEPRVATIKLPAPRDVLLKVCPRDSVANGEGMLHGTLRTRNGEPLRNTAVIATWLANMNIVGNLTADQVRFTERSLGAISDDRGAWRFCGVPRDWPITLRVASDSGSDTQKVRLMAEFATVGLIARPGGGASELPLADGARVRLSALVEFTVYNHQYAPLSNVTLEVRGAGGGVRTVSTGSGGKALLPDVPPGALTIRARHIGFKQGEVIARVEAGRNTVPIILNEIAAPSLDTVRVVGDRVTLRRHDEFEERRARKEATASITREEIVKRNPPNLWQMLMGIPSIRIADRDTMVVAVSTRTVVTSIKNQGPCFITIMIDGTIMNPDPSKGGYDLRMLPAPDEIHGIEVFAGAATIPLKYGGTGNGKWCGMIAIWTR